MNINGLLILSVIAKVSLPSGIECSVYFCLMRGTAVS